MAIPKIIHQTWKDKNIPGRFQLFADTWKKNHPDWEYILWTDEMNRSFIQNNFPGFLKKYDSYPTVIQRVDAVRYFVLYKMGGMYVDLDFECFRNVEGLLDESSCVFGKEPEKHCKDHKKDLIISNAFMASEKSALFFETLIHELSVNTDKVAHPFNRVLESTGPFMLTRVYQRFSQKEAIKILESDTIFPLIKMEAVELLSSNNHLKKSWLRDNGVYAVHYYDGSWWKPKITAEIVK